MRKTNINHMMKMTRDYLNGKMSYISYTLDFPYELEKRYQDMVSEHREYAELIYDYLCEEVVDQCDNLSDDEFREKLEENYNYIKGVVRDGFY